MPSKSLYWHTFGSLTVALREAGFDVLVGEERLERAILQGVAMARSLGRLPRFADWAEARRADPTLLTEWQVYRMLDVGRGTWSAFQYLIRERLVAEEAEVAPDDRQRPRERLALAVEPFHPVVGIWQEPRPDRVSRSARAVQPQALPERCR